MFINKAWWFFPPASNNTFKTNLWKLLFPWFTIVRMLISTTCDSQYIHTLATKRLIVTHSKNATLINPEWNQHIIFCKQMYWKLFLFLF